MELHGEFFTNEEALSYFCGIANEIQRKQSDKDVHLQVVLSVKNDIHKVTITYNDNEETEKEKEKTNKQKALEQVQNNPLYSIPVYYW